MTLEERVNADMKEAMRAKDAAALRAIRAITAAILLLKTDGSGLEVTAEREIQLLQKMVKQRRESLGIFEKQNRPDLAQGEQEEIAVIERYLPQQLSDTEIEAIVKNIIAETGASSIKDMGKVVGAANKQLAGQAEGATIARIVKSLLG